MPISCQKKVHFFKNTVLSRHFFRFFMKNPPLSCPYLVTHRQFCQNSTILWARKVDRMLFISIYHEKLGALMPTFCQKNVHSLKNTVPSCQFFFNFLMRNPLFSCSYLVKKSAILSKKLLSKIVNALLFCYKLGSLAFGRVVDFKGDRAICLYPILSTNNVPVYQTE